MSFPNLRLKAPKSDCTLCRTTPVDDTTETKKVLPMIVAVGIDVNWGEDMNICLDCAGVISDLIDRRPAGESHDWKLRAQDLEEELEQANAKLEAQQERFKRIVEGRKAEKEQKEVA